MKKRATISLLFVTVCLFQFNCGDDASTNNQNSSPVSGSWQYTSVEGVSECWTFGPDNSVSICHDSNTTGTVYQDNGTYSISRNRLKVTFEGNDDTVLYVLYKDSLSDSPLYDYSIDSDTKNYDNYAYMIWTDLGYNDPATPWTDGPKLIATLSKVDNCFCSE